MGETASYARIFGSMDIKWRSRITPVKSINLAKFHHFFISTKFL